MRVDKLSAFWILSLAFVRRCALYASPASLSLSRLPVFAARSYTGFRTVLLRGFIGKSRTHRGANARYNGFHRAQILRRYNTRAEISAYFIFYNAVSFLQAKLRIDKDDIVHALIYFFNINIFNRRLWLSMRFCIVHLFVTPIRSDKRYTYII